MIRVVAEMGSSGKATYTATVNCTECGAFYRLGPTRTVVSVSWFLTILRRHGWKVGKRKVCPNCQKATA